jgi:hypothetical protein
MNIHYCFGQANQKTFKMKAKEAKKGKEEETIFGENENPPKIQNKKCAISIMRKDSERTG